MSGIFGLSGAYDRNLSGLIPEKTRPTFREYGYFGGGTLNGVAISRSTVDRIDYSNDTTTASVRGPLLAARGYRPGGTGNSSFGYIAGGYPITSIIYRTNYSNDSSSPIPRSILSLERRFLTSTGNQSFGYFGGGYCDGIGVVSTIDRIDYSNDSNAASFRSNLTSNKDTTAVGNSNFGYFGGGPGPVDTIERLSYNNDTSSPLVRGELSLSRVKSAATGNSSFGYFGGGSPGVGVLSRVDRIDYSNDTVQASPRGSLILERTQPAATGNSNFGYFGGGSNTVPSTRTNFSQIQRVDYSSDTVTTSTRGNHTSAVGWHSSSSSASFGGAPNSQYGVFAKPFGYFGGGGVPAQISTIQRIDYTNDTQTAIVRNFLTDRRVNLAATGNASFGYFGGGAVPGPTLVSIIDRIDYINDNTTTSTRGSLSAARYSFSATGNSNFGYFGGGINPATPAIFSTVDRLSYSTDTSTTLVRGSLSDAKYTLGSTSTSNFGYFGGGGVPGPVALSTIDRIDYSNDTQTASSRTEFLTETRQLTATGNQNFGYFGGGVNAKVTVNRLDYSNDTVQPLIRGPLGFGRQLFSATGNSNFGYFGGGASPSLVSIIERIDYANDNVTASNRGPLSSAIFGLAASSPTDFGGAKDFQATQTFFDIQSVKSISDTTNYSVKKRALNSFGYAGGGGYQIGTSQGVISTVDRTDYSNDTTNAITRSFVPYPRRDGAAPSNKNYGYFGGGINLGAVDKLDFSNDTSTKQTSSLLSFFNYCSGSSTDNYGYYILGNNFPTKYSNTRRLDYSNDSANTLVRGVFSASKYYTGATNNKVYTWVVGGYDGSSTLSTIERFSFSNDNVRTSVRGSLIIGRNRCSSVGNDDYGYYINGGVPSPDQQRTTERLDYSNDTLSLRKKFPIYTYVTGDHGNENYGYICGGAINSFNGYSSIYRLDYSNDFADYSFRSVLPRGKLSVIGTTNARTA